MKLANRDAVYRRDRYTCRFCGRKDRPLTLDHILPLSRGGHPTKKANLVTCCQKCNQHKANRTPEEAGMFILEEGFSYMPPGKLADGVEALIPLIFRAQRMSRKKVRRQERLRRKALLQAMNWGGKYG